MVNKQFAFWAKSCSKCGKEKELDEFPRNKNGLHGRHSNCKECHNKRNKDRYQRGVKVAGRPVGSNYRTSHLRRTYGISLAQYNELLERQDHCCAICGKHESEETRSLAVDHDHVTGEIRGLLCTYCNHRIVGRHRDGELLRKIADYIEQGTGWFVPKKPRKRKKKSVKS